MYQLTRQDIEPTEVFKELAWQIVLTVDSDDNVLLPKEVFVFQIEDGDDPESRSWFTCIASPAQLLEYPVDEPAAPVSGEIWQPYFRKDTLTIVSRSHSALESLYEQIKEELVWLRRNLEAAQELTPGETVEL